MIDLGVADQIDRLLQQDAARFATPQRIFGLNAGPEIVENRVGGVQEAIVPCRRQASLGRSGLGEHVLVAGDGGHTAGKKFASLHVFERLRGAPLPTRVHLELKLLKIGEFLRHSPHHFPDVRHLPPDGDRHLPRLGRSCRSPLKLPPQQRQQRMDQRFAPRDPSGDRCGGDRLGEATRLGVRCRRLNAGKTPL